MNGALLLLQSMLYFLLNSWTSLSASAPRFTIPLSPTGSGKECDLNDPPKLLNTRTLKTCMIWNSEVCFHSCITLTCNYIYSQWILSSFHYAFVFPTFLYPVMNLLNALTFDKTSTTAPPECQAFWVDDMSTCTRFSLKGGFKDLAD